MLGYDFSESTGVTRKLWALKMRLPPRVLHIAAFISATWAVAHAQSFPTRTLTMVIPFAAGGPSDVAGRILAQGMSEVLGQQVIVENLSGAGGTIGSLHVANAAPDGYQFVLGNSGTHVWSQALYKKPPYNTTTDFAPVALVVESPRTLITPTTSMANSLAQLIDYLKKNQQTAKYGSAGAGSSSHISCVLFNSALGIDITHVPYRGLGPAMQDLIAGRIDYLCDSPSTTLPQFQGGLVKVLATTGAERWPTLPKVPTAKEQGLDFVVTAWQAIFLPRDTPTAIVQRLNTAVSQALDLPPVRGRLSDIGEGVVASERRSADYLRGLVVSEIDRWSGPIRASGASMD
jgi:tripartite-type tricarboxylate transporter receptor subunit TctC